MFGRMLTVTGRHEVCGWDFVRLFRARLIPRQVDPGPSDAPRRRWNPRNVRGVHVWQETEGRDFRREVPQPLSHGPPVRRVPAPEDEAMVGDRPAVRGPVGHDQPRRYRPRPQSALASDHRGKAPIAVQRADEFLYVDDFALE